MRDNLKNEDDHKNEEDLKIEDDLQNENSLKNGPPGIQLYLNSWKFVHLGKCYSDIFVP